jgi:hypothetical protein
MRGTQGRRRLGRPLALANREEGEAGQKLTDAKSSVVEYKGCDKNHNNHS